MPDFDWMKPRDPSRIEPILAELRRVWSMYPDWRLGQVVSNAAARVVGAGHPADPFYVEDDEMRRALGELIGD